MIEQGETLGFLTFKHISSQASTELILKALWPQRGSESQKIEEAWQDFNLNTVCG